MARTMNKEIESTEPVANGYTGPRIVINPTTFKNSKDALCTAFNEGFRLWMEATDFSPKSEPTEKQRKFFADTAYADDELQMRRTILARIATFDTSVKDPTDDQLAETASFLNAILESDWCKNDWERNSVAKLAKAVAAAVGAEPVEPKAEPIEPRAQEPLQARAALGAGETDENKNTSSASAASASTEGTQEQQVPVTDTQTTAQPTEQAPAQTTEQATAQAPAQTPAQAPAQTPAQAPAQTTEQNPTQTPATMSGLKSGVWTGGEEGKGRQLTAREAEWMKQRIDSGASVSGSQLAMFGLSRNRTGQIVNENGEVHTGFGTNPANAVASNPDAGLDKNNNQNRFAITARTPLNKKKSPTV